MGAEPETNAPGSGLNTQLRSDQPDPFEDLGGDESGDEAGADQTQINRNTHGPVQEKVMPLQQKGGDLGSLWPETL